MATGGGGEIGREPNREISRKGRKLGCCPQPAPTPSKKTPSGIKLCVKVRCVEEAIGQTFSCQDQEEARSLQESTRNDNPIHRVSQATRRRGVSQEP